MMQQLAADDDDDDDYDVKWHAGSCSGITAHVTFLETREQMFPSRAESPSSLPSAGPAHVDRAD